MTEDQIITRMDELGRIAKARMDATAHHTEKSYSEIMHMTQEEASEMLELRLTLPSSGEERRAAIARIEGKIKMRKGRLSALQEVATGLE